MSESVEILKNNGFITFAPTPSEIDFGIDIQPPSHNMVLQTQELWKTCCAY